MTSPPESAHRAHQSVLYLDAARQHLAEASKILKDRPDDDRGAAADEAALLIAQARAEAAMSHAESARRVAEAITTGIQLRGKLPEGPFSALVRSDVDPLTAIVLAIDKLIDKLDDIDR